MGIIESDLNRDSVIIEEILNRYVGYLHKYRNLTDNSIRRHKLHAGRFLKHFERNKHICLQDILNVNDIQLFSSEYAQNNGHGSSHNMFSTLRVFLRYLHMDGQTDQDLSEAVPTLHRRQLSQIPRCISEEHTEQLLASIDRSEMIGKRDYAIIQMLNTYGVRGVHVRKLRLEHVYWHDNRIFFMPAKGGKKIIQHLSSAVGNSLLDYLQYARQKDAPYSEVFLTCTGIPRPLFHSASVSGIIMRRLKYAGVKLPDGVSQGSHSFRHAFATRMVCGSQPFKYVADMLGHKILNSTMIYTKIDLPAMRQAMLEWPEVSS